METKLSSKGQIVLPRQLRQSRGWSAGQRFRVETSGGAVVLTPVEENRYTLDDLVGCTAYEGRVVSLEEMEAAIRDEAVTRFKKSSR
ncbi:MAG: AbrB/MazE/SpoVT family DNA-binding domain-containing protein [Myxococcota bacterium]